MTHETCIYTGFNSGLKIGNLNGKGSFSNFLNMEQSRELVYHIETILLVIEEQKKNHMEIFLVKENSHMPKMNRRSCIVVVK